MKVLACLVLALACATVMSNPAPTIIKKKLALAAGAASIISKLKSLKKGDDCVQEPIKEVQVIEEKPVITEVIREVPVQVIREEPYERIVHVDRPVQVIKEVPVERLVHVDQPYTVVKEVQVEKIVHKRVEVPVEVKVPVPVHHEKIVEVPVPVEKITRIERPVYVKQARANDCDEAKPCATAAGGIGGELLKKLKSHL